MLERCICEVFKTAKREGLYLYVNKQEGFERVPDALLDSFAEPQSALVFALSPDRRLAQLDASMLLKALDENGYYLQVPPEPPATAKVTTQTEGGTKDI